MQVVPFPARPARSHYRHPLCTLTYVTIDDGNGGIVRNLNSDGVAVQAVAPLREQQRVRMRFELRFPRLRVEAYGQVSWTSHSGRCGIRFVDLPPRTIREINAWIFSNLLDGLAPGSGHHSIFGISRGTPFKEDGTLPENDGLILSPPPRPSIRPEIADTNGNHEKIFHPSRREAVESSYEDSVQQNRLSGPLSGETLAHMIDGLIVLAGLLLFTVIFLSIAHELPAWPLTAAAATAAAVFVIGAYRALFAVFGGVSLGVRVAQLVSSSEEYDDREESRFR